MKKIFFTSMVLVLFAIGFAASDDSSSESSSTSSEASATVNEETPTDVIEVTALKMQEDLDENELRAQKTYLGKWVKVSGPLGNMDSEGDYFTIEGQEFSFADVCCTIPSDKKEEITNFLMNMNKGENVVVIGKVVDMGEVMGYEVKIHEISR
uniref:OB-fold protein n=1 Tax=Prevotella sp. TaxID=59823 RepID=UPI00402A4D5D